MKYLILLFVVGIIYVNSSYAEVPADYKSFFKDDPYAIVDYQSNSSIILRVIDMRDMVNVGIFLDTVRQDGGYTVNSMVSDNNPESNAAMWIYLTK